MAMYLAEQLKSMQLVLASQSPRRKQLLEALGLTFIVRPTQTDESVPNHLSREAIALHLAKTKAKAALEKAKENELIIAADTIVWQQGQLFNKPDNVEEAFRMLEKLSDKIHEVITAVTLASQKKQSNFYVVSEVAFKKLHKTEIDYYLQSNPPLDKAGAYGIQDWIGLIGVERIHGSYTNIVGLPTKELAEELLFFCK